jgi:hypothetical protein
VAELHDAPQDVGLAPVPIDAAHQGHVDLDDVRLELRERREPA